MSNYFFYFLFLDITARNCACLGNAFVSYCSPFKVNVIMFNFSSHFKLWYLLLEVVSLTKVIDLSTSRWILSNDREQTIDNRIIENIVGRSLQRICTDDLQIIGDPMKDFNDIDQRWIIENTSWTIRTIFNITNPPERFLSTWLIIDQVQTIARFYVNGTRAEILMLNEPLYETNVNVFRKSKICIQDLNWQTKILLKKGVALEKQSFTLALDTKHRVYFLLCFFKNEDVPGNV
ncbi:hypothetical protein ACOME3_001819 [Neoechinorhynchus agilis]